jgi:hypothetical protein
MKSIKRLYLALILLASTIAFSTDSEAFGGRPRTPSNPPYNQTDNYTHQNRGGQAGAPLDGGLLALLAGAGIVYVAGRRKKKNKE